MTQQLFLDCDGVLADFDKGYEALFGKFPDRDNPISSDMWQALKSHKNFYGTLPLLTDAMELYQAVKHLRPIILTGMPLGNWALPQKLGWRDKWFPGVPMVTCLSKNKSLYCQPGDVLVDDWRKYQMEWTDAGGQFVYHLKTKDTLTELIALGILQ